MTISRIRRACAIGALAALAPLGGAFAQNAPYPSQTIKFVVPYPAGGATDTLARTVAQKLQEAWGQPVVVENRAGAAGTIGNSLVAKANADGYTVLVAITALIQQQSLMEKLPYDPLKDFAPVTLIARSPSMFAVPLDSPAKSLKEFIAMAKANPGKYSYGTYGAGTSSHIQGSLLNMQAGLDLVHVPFNGAAPLVTNLVGGQLPSAFIDSAVGAAAPQVDPAPGRHRHPAHAWPAGRADLRSSWATTPSTRTAGSACSCPPALRRPWCRSCPTRSTASCACPTSPPRSRRWACRSPAASRRKYKRPCAATPRSTPRSSRTRISG